MNERNDFLEIDLKQLFQILWSRVWAIVITAIVAVALVLTGTFFLVTPQYQSSVRLYVNNSTTSTAGYSSSQIVAAQSLADTYMVILESRSMLTDVIADTGVSYSVTQLEKMITATAVNETEVFEVVVESPDPQEAANIANSIAKLLPNKIAAVVNGSSVRVVDDAVVAKDPSSPSYPRNAILGFLAGALLSAVVIVIRELTDESIASEDYLARAYEGIPLLAVVPDSNGTKSSSYYKKGYYEATDKRPANRPAGKR